MSKIIGKSMEMECRLEVGRGRGDEKPLLNGCRVVSGSSPRVAQIKSNSGRWLGNSSFNLRERRREGGGEGSIGKEVRET